MAVEKTWREMARPLIAKTIKANEGKPLPEIRKALAAVYPFGPRKYWPYKIWCDEIRFQLGLKKHYPKPYNPNQMSLFNAR